MSYLHQPIYNKVSVWDWDRVGADDFLGMSEVLVSDIVTECEKCENELQEAEADMMEREESEEGAQIRRVGVAGE
jgi:hypothetical protein